MVGPCFLLEGKRPVLEEFLLPAVEDRRLEFRFITASRWAPCPANVASEWRPSLPARSASVASSCVLSFTLLRERLFHFQLNRNRAQKRSKPQRMQSHRSSKSNGINPQEFRARLGIEADVAMNLHRNRAS